VAGEGTAGLRHPVDKAVFFLIGIGAVLRIAQYLAATSLWGDELYVVRNVISKGPFTLFTQPIGNLQVAPCGFVLLLKLVVTLIGTSEYSLRLIPFLSSLLTLPLFASLGHKFLPREALLLALGLFSTSIPLIRYAGQVKPYSSDVVASLLCLLVARAWMEAKTLRASFWAAMTGAIVIWFSYTSVFTLAAVALVVLGQFRTSFSGASVKHVLVVLTIWLCSAATFAIVEYHRLSPETHLYMQTFWAHWMLPVQLTIHSVATWLVRLARDFFAFLGLAKWWILCVLVLIGTCCLLRRTSETLLLVVPLLMTFAASALRLYPFGGRLILFLVPNMLLMLTAGVLAVTGAAGRLQLPRWGQNALLLAAALALGVHPVWTSPPPYRDSETKPILSYLAEHRLSGDSIYLQGDASGTAQNALEFYGPRFSLPVSQVTLEPYTGPLPLETLKDLDQFRGLRRLWVVFGPTHYVQLRAARWYLDTIGHRLDCLSSHNAAVYLYDLSDAQRLRSAKAEDFSVEMREANDFGLYAGAPEELFKCH
jgi:hypothetical protein